MRKNVLGTDVTDAGILRSLRDVQHHAVVAVDQAARGRSVRTTVQFGGTQTDLYSGVAEDSSTLVPPASKLILDASGVPVVPFSPADPGIAAVDWISVDENDISSYRPKPAGDDPADIALLAELHEEARTSRPPTPGEIA